MNREIRSVMYAVIKADGTFAGAPCYSLEEARNRALEHKDSWIFLMTKTEKGKYKK